MTSTRHHRRIAPYLFRLRLILWKRHFGRTKEAKREAFTDDVQQRYAPLQKATFSKIRTDHFAVVTQMPPTTVDEQTKVRTAVTLQWYQVADAEGTSQVCHGVCTKNHKDVRQSSSLSDRHEWLPTDLRRLFAMAGSTARISTENGVSETLIDDAVASRELHCRSKAASAMPPPRPTMRTRSAGHMGAFTIAAWMARSSRRKKQRCHTLYRVRPRALTLGRCEAGLMVLVSKDPALDDQVRETPRGWTRSHAS